MVEVEDFIESIVAIFVILILVYVFFIAFQSLSPPLAWLFVILAVVVIFGMLIRIFRE